MPVGNVNGSLGSAAPNTRVAPNSSTLTMDSFMLLLAKQLENQDFNNPMSNSEMMQQLTSMATVQAMNTSTELSSTQYALGLIGQTVRVAGSDETTGSMEIKEGKVIGINLSEMKVYIEGSNEGYGLGNVMEVGIVPKKEEDEDDKGDGNDTTTDPPTDGDKDDNTTDKSRMGRTVAAPQSDSPYAQMVYSSPIADTSSEKTGTKTSVNNKAVASSSDINYANLSVRAQQLAKSGSLDPDKAAALARQSNQSLPADKQRALEAQQAMRNSRIDMGPSYTGSKKA